MRITQIKQILEIEKCNSISQAARNLYISQPGLSALLTEFEAEVGIPIFSRTKSGVVPTEDGVSINELTGDITIMIGSSYEFLFAELIQRFKKNFPKATLRILDNLSHNVHDQVNKDLIDFALMTVTDHAGEPIDEKILREQYKNMSVLPLLLLRYDE